MLERKNARTAPPRNTKRMRDNRTDKQSDRKTNGDRHQLLGDVERVAPCFGAICLRRKAEYTAVAESRGQLEEDTSNRHGEARAVREAAVNVAEGAYHKRADGRYDIRAIDKGQAGEVIGYPAGHRDEDHNRQLFREEGLLVAQTEEQRISGATEEVCESAMLDTWRQSHIHQYALGVINHQWTDLWVVAQV